MVALDKMSSFLGEDDMMKNSTLCMQALILARIANEQRIQQIRHDSGLSKYYTIANGMGSNGLSLSCERDGSYKPSPLRNVINASNIVPVPSMPSMQFYMNFT